MHLNVEKSNGKQKCRYQLCEKNPLYISPKGRIIAGKTCVSITLDSASGWNSSYYCRSCIEKIYLEMKMILNPKLWVFQ
jgi:hypothetical protein